MGHCQRQWHGGASFHRTLLTEQWHKMARRADGECSRVGCATVRDSGTAGSPSACFGLWTVGSGWGRHCQRQWHSGVAFCLLRALDGWDPVGCATVRDRGTTESPFACFGFGRLGPVGDATVRDSGTAGLPCAEKSPTSAESEGRAGVGNRSWIYFGGAGFLTVGGSR